MSGRVSNIFPFDKPDCSIGGCSYKVFYRRYCYPHSPWWRRAAAWLEVHKIEFRWPIRFVIGRPWWREQIAKRLDR